MRTTAIVNRARSRAGVSLRFIDFTSCVPLFLDDSLGASAILRDIAAACARAFLSLSFLELEFEAFVADDVGALASWLTSEPWPFHGLRQQWTEEEVLAAVSSGEFTGVNRSVWVRDGDTRVGLLRFRWLDETSPEVDLRVLARYRGRGVGTAMLEWAAASVFTETERHRLSGETRVDNLAMRRVFERCGWTQEAYYRASWPDGRGGWTDSVGYAILRDDWTAEGAGGS